MKVTSHADKIHPERIQSETAPTKKQEEMHSISCRVINGRTKYEIRLQYEECQFEKRSDSMWRKDG